MRAADRAWARTGLRVALAHHPLCSVFAHDVVRLGGVRVCSGCVAAAPAFAAGLVVALLLAAPAWPLLLLGLAMGAPHLATYRWRGRRGARFAAKAVGGAGLGLVFAALLQAPLAWQALAFLGMGLSFAALQALRLRSIQRTCQACPWGARWAACPGFAPDEAARSAKLPVRLASRHGDSRHEA